MGKSNSVDLPKVNRRRPVVRTGLGGEVADILGDRERAQTIGSPVHATVRVTLALCEAGL